ncbi:MAG: sulfatase [Myxococcota bacterium]
MSAGRLGRRVWRLALAAAVLGCGGLAGCAAERERPPALLLVTVDTLRTDHLGAYGSDRGLTPHLDALAERSVVFDRAYAAAPFTVPSVSALLTGRFPEETGIHSNEVRLPDDLPTLASALQAAGWRTAAVVSNFVLRRSSGLDRGFQVFDDRMTQRELIRKWPERDAPTTTEAAVELLRQIALGDTPFFLWVHYQDPHGPYTPPDALRAAQLGRERARPGGREELALGRDHRGLGALPTYQAIDDEREVAFYRAGYAGEVAFMDAGVGRLLDELDALGLRDSTTVVFTADHGEGLGDHDYWFAHGEYLTDELTRVPLWVAHPGLEPGRRADLVSQVDLFASLASLLGIEVDGRAPYVRDLWAPGAESGASTAYMASLTGSIRPRVGLVRGDHKVVGTRREGRTEYTLFALGAEDRDLGGDDPALLETMVQELESLRGSLLQRRSQGQELSESDREALRALGYLDDGDE